MENRMKVRDSSIAYQFHKVEMDRIVDKIRDGIQAIKVDKMEVGKWLYDAKKLLDHGEFKLWIIETFGNELPYSTAIHYRNLYVELMDKDDIILMSLPIWFLQHMYQKDFPNEVKDIIYSNLFVSIQYGNLEKVVEAYKAFKKGEITLDEFKAMTETEAETGKAIMDENRKARKKERFRTEIQKLMRLFWRIDKNIEQFKKHFIKIQSVNPLLNDQISDMHGRVEEVISLFHGLNDFFDEKLSQKSNY